MTSHEERRLQRLDEIKRAYLSAKAKGKEVSEEQLIAEGCAKWGATRRTMLEYIKIVKAVY